MEEGDDDECDRRCHRVGGDLGHHLGQPGEAALDQACQGRLADPAEPEGGERDAELGGGDIAVERLYRTARQSSFAIPFFFSKGASALKRARELVRYN